MDERKLEIQLFGGFFCRWSDGEHVDIRGMKHRALIAVLATAINGTHTRAWVCETLWQLSGDVLGRASLRRALSDIRKVFGDRFDAIFHTTNADVGLNMDRIELIGSPTDGVFLDGITLPEPGFRAWLAEKRRHHKTNFGAELLASRTTLAPKLAVLPFLPRRCGENEQHLADLLAMEVTRLLSRSRLIDVISHLSSRRVDARNLDLSAIREALGFDYVVYGNLRVEDAGYRVEVDLADAASGRVVWTGDFAGEMADLLNGQSDVVMEMSRRIGHGILTASVELAHSRPLNATTDHALLMSSVTLMHGHNLAEFVRAKSQLEELLRRQPKQANLHAWYAKWHVLSAHQGMPYNNQAHDVAKASSARALDADPRCSFSLAVDGMVHSHNAPSDPTVAERFEQSLQIDPNNAMAWLLYSRMHMFDGDGQKALSFASRADQLSPCDPHQYFFDCLHACAKSVNGDYAGALELAERSLKANPRHSSTHRVKAISLAMMGKDAEARLAADALLRWEPELTIKSYLENHPAGGDRDMPRQWADALRRAGVPEA